MRKKGFLPILILLVIIILGIVIYFIFSHLYLLPDRILKDDIITGLPSIAFEQHPTTSDQTTPSFTKDWMIYKSDKFNFEFKYPNDWQIIFPSEYSFTVSNKYFDPSLNGVTPLPGQVFLRFYLTHSASENYSTDKKVYRSTEGVDVIEQGRYIDPSASISIISLYRVDDVNVKKYEETINQIISTFKLTN